MEYNKQGIVHKASFNINGTDVWESEYSDPILGHLGDEVEGQFDRDLKSIPNYQRCLLIGFITDSHLATTTYWNEVVTAEPSFKLLSKICHDYDVSAVFHGGDYINGRDEEGETKETKLINMRISANMIKRYFSDTPFIPTYGNHDTRYGVASEIIRNSELFDIFKDCISCDDKVRVEIIDDTNYIVDFIDYKVRIIVYNCYDLFEKLTDENPTQAGSNGANPSNSAIWTKGLNLAEGYNASEWIIGAVSHYFLYSGIRSYFEAYRNKTASFRNWVNKNKEAGKGYLGTMNGHAHIWDENHKYINTQILTTCAYANQSKQGTSNAFGFAVFAIDVENFKWYQIKVGGNGGVVAMDIVHDSATATLPTS